MSYKLMCVMPLIKLDGGRVIDKKGEVFEVESEKVRDDLIEAKNAIDITNGMPATIQTDKDIVLAQLEAEKNKSDALAKELAELRQQLKGSVSNESQEEADGKANKKGGK